jgi:hypothetical protein
MGLTTDVALIVSNTLPIPRTVIRRSLALKNS